MQPPRRGTDILATGFGTTVAVWTLLYVAAVPPGARFVWIVIAAAIAGTLFAGGWLLGRRAGRGPMGGAGLGAMVAGVSLLVLMSLLGGDWAQMGPGLLWIGGFLLVAAGLCSLGAYLGRRGAPADLPQVNWTARFAGVTVLTTVLMLAAGGVVTGLEAGLAVEGWLNAEGHFLALFPIGMMRRDVPTFVEHAHRLWGLLVGLTTLVLTVHVWMRDRRGATRALATAIVLGVIVQGVLGGTRVTEQSAALGIAHGVFAQVILAALVGLWMMTTEAWQSDAPRTVRPTVGTDRLMTTLLVVAILVQITLGTLFRHLQPDPDVPRGLLMGTLHGHSFVGSMIVAVLAVFCGARAWGLYAAERPVKRAGSAVVHAVVMQVLLGVAAFVVVPKGPRDPGGTIGTAEVIITTSHQVMGALLLATAVTLWLWERRRLELATSH